VGQRVEAGNPLFRLDDRHLRAELSVRQAGLDLAKAERERLENLPRKDQVPVSEAAVAEAEAHVAEQQYQLTRTRELFNIAAAKPDELNSCERAFEAAQARLARVRAELDLLKAGSWDYDKAIARATVAQAQTQVELARTELDRLVVRAQVAGQVLQVNLRPGEFVGAPAGQALIVLGNIDLLHVRVDIDEYDIPRFRSGAPAKAMLKGSPQEEFPLRFVRVEPFVIPKRALTGENTERVDTRVLQVIYTIEVKREDLYVGQQLDVFIDAGSPPAPQGADLTPAA
jgi:multidrug resistance efflux pump